MTIQEFEQAIQRGQGRAALCLLENDPKPYLTALMYACVRDRRWTVWTEDARGPYLLYLAAYADAEDFVEEVILQVLPKLTDEWDKRQAWRILNQLTAEGRLRPRAAVLAYALRDPEGVSLVANQGVKGLAWLLQVRPELFAEIDGDADDWIESAEDVSGTEAVDAILTPAIRAGRQAYRERERIASESEPPALTVEDLVKALRRTPRKLRRFHTFYFGRSAPPEEHRRLAEAMLTLNHPKIIALLGNVFRKTPWPFDLSTMRDRLTDPRLGSAWRRVFEAVEDPRLREWAWELLEQDPPLWDALDWLEVNFQAGDEDRLWALLQREEEKPDWLRHNISLSLRQISELVGVDRVVPHLEWQLENTPCSFCRVNTYKALHKKGLLADRYRREAAYDSEYDIRLLADDRQNPRLAIPRFVRAVGHGLGRAALCLQSGDPKPYIPHLVKACLTETYAFAADREDRPAYIARLAEIAGCQEAVIGAIHKELTRTPESASRTTFLRDLLAEFEPPASPKPETAAEEEPIKPPPATTLEELLQRIEHEPKSSHRAREARRMGRVASPDELQRIAERILTEEDPDLLVALANVFRMKPWPLAPYLVLDRIDDDTWASRAWRKMVREIRHPMVRDFAIQRLQRDSPDRDALMYLYHHFKPGDEALILDALRRIDTEDSTDHFSLCRGIDDLAKHYGPDDFLPHLEWALEHAQFPGFRLRFVETLLKANALSDYHRAEAHFDQNPATRALVL